MLFILQKESEYMDLDVDLLTLRQELKKQKYQHEYTTMGLMDFSDDKIDDKLKDAVVVGTINFVQKYLSKYHHVDNMNPIEVPMEMRLSHLLNRDYSIVTADKIPWQGKYFIKDVSKLKQFSYCGNMEYFMYDGIFDKPTKQFDTNLHLDATHLYQVSSVVNILSEYRVFVVDDDIKGIQFYDGDPTIMPTPDEIKKIKEMVTRYMINKSRPGAYSLDIAVISTKNGRDIAVLEVHPFASVGLYGLYGSFLPMAYRLGLDYYINHNTKMEPSVREES